jgi:hypothetical protein
MFCKPKVYIPVWRRRLGGAQQAPVSCPCPGGWGPSWPISTRQRPSSGHQALGGACEGGPSEVRHPSMSTQSRWAKWFNREKSITSRIAIVLSRCMETLNWNSSTLMILMLHNGSTITLEYIIFYWFICSQWTWTFYVVLLHGSWTGMTQTFRWQMMLSWCCQMMWRHPVWLPSEQLPRKNDPSSLSLSPWEWIAE